MSCLLSEPRPELWPVQARGFATLTSATTLPPDPDLPPTPTCPETAPYIDGGGNPQFGF